MLFRVTSHFQRPKESLIWQRNQKFYLRFSKKIKLEFSKSSDLFWLNQFQLKIKKSGRCHNLANGRTPWWNFCGNRSWRSSFLMLFAYFVYITHLTKLTRGSLLRMEKSMPIEKSIEEKVLLNASLSDRNNKTCLQCDAFPWKSWFIVIDARRSCCPIGLRLRRQGI